MHEKCRRIAIFRVNVTIIAASSGNDRTYIHNLIQYGKFDSFKAFWAAHFPH
jgi:hypothetical protein